MPTQTQRYELPSGQEVRVRPVERVDRDTVRVDVTAGARWRLDVDDDGAVELVSSWNAEGELADVPLPDWLDNVIMRLV